MRDLLGKAGSSEVTSALNGLNMRNVHIDLVQGLQAKTVHVSFTLLSFLYLNLILRKFASKFENLTFKLSHPINLHRLDAFISAASDN